MEITRRSAAPPAGRGAPPARPLAHAAARPGRRHRGRAAGAARRARHPLDPGAAHRRHLASRARAAAREAPHRPGHHAREPVAPPLPPGRPRALRRAPPGGGGRVARAAGEQARRPDRARPRPPAPLPAGAAHLGALGHARQSRQPRWRRCSAPARTGRLVRGAAPKEIARRLADPGRRSSASPGPGTWGSSCCRRWSPAIEEGRTALVFTNTRSQTEIWYQAILDARPDWAGEIALHHGSLDRKVRDFVEDGLRAGAPALRRLHLQPRPRRRLLAGRPRAAGGEPEGGRPPAAAGRPQRPPAGRAEPGDLRAHQRLRAGGGGRRPRRPWRRGGSSRGTPLEKPLDVLAQHLVTVAVGGGFRAAELYAEVRTRLGLPRPHPRRVGLDARLRHPRRPGARRLPRVPPGGRAGRPLHRARPRRSRGGTGCRSAPSPATPRSTVQYVARRPARHRRGVVHRPPAAGRPLRLRRPHAGARRACAT